MVCDGRLRNCPDVSASTNHGNENEVDPVDDYLCLYDSSEGLSGLGIYLPRGSQWEYLSKERRVIDETFSGGFDTQQQKNPSSLSPWASPFTLSSPRTLSKTPGSCHTSSVEASIGPQSIAPSPTVDNFEDYWTDMVDWLTDDDDASSITTFEDLCIPDECASDWWVSTWGSQVECSFDAEDLVPDHHMASIPTILTSPPFEFAPTSSSFLKTAAISDSPRQPLDTPNTESGWHHPRSACRMYEERMSSDGKDPGFAVPRRKPLTAQEAKRRAENQKRQLALASPSEGDMQPYALCI